MNRVKFSLNPYNINRLTLKAGEAALNDTAYFDKRVSSICVSLVFRSMLTSRMAHSSKILSRAASSACISSGVPMVTRSQLAMRGASKCRTSTPFSFNFLAWTKQQLEARGFTCHWGWQ